MRSRENALQNPHDALALGCSEGNGGDSAWHCELSRCHVPVVENGYSPPDAPETVTTNHGRYPIRPWIKLSTSYRSLYRIRLYRSAFGISITLRGR